MLTDDMGNGTYLTGHIQADGDVVLEMVSDETGQRMEVELCLSGSVNDIGKRLAAQSFVVAIGGNDLRPAVQTSVKGSENGD